MWYCIGCFLAAAKGCELVKPFVGEALGETAASDALAVAASKITAQRKKIVNFLPSWLKERLHARFLLTRVTNIEHEIRLIAKKPATVRSAL
jgi:hypothetical protein